MHILVVDLGLNVIVIFDFAGGNGLVGTQQKKLMTYPPLANLIFVPHPHTLISMQQYIKYDTIINLHACAVNNWQHVRL